MPRAASAALATLAPLMLATLFATLAASSRWAVAAARSLDARPRDDAFHTRCYEQALYDFDMLQLDFATFHLLAESLLDRDALLRMTSPPL